MDEAFTYNLRSKCYKANSKHGSAAVIGSGPDEFMKNAYLEAEGAKDDWIIVYATLIKQCNLLINNQLRHKNINLMEITGFSENGQLGQQMSQLNDNIQPSSPEDMSPKGLVLNQQDGPALKQNTNVEDGPNESPASFHSFEQESLQRRAKKSFVRKLYVLMGVQLVTTIAFCCFSYFCRPVLQFQLTYWWVSFVVLALMNVGFAILLSGERFRQYPNNITFLFFYTLCFSYLISMITSNYASAYGRLLVVGVAALALLIVIGLTIFALLTPNEYNPLYGTLYGTLSVIALSFVGFGILYILAFESGLYQLYCAAIVAMVGILTLIDSKLIGGRRSIDISKEDYLIGLLMLEVDIVRACLRLCQMLRAKK